MLFQQLLELEEVLDAFLRRRAAPLGKRGCRGRHGGPEVGTPQRLVSL